MALRPDTSIQFLKAVGEKRAALYKKLGLATVRDLLYHFPRDYIDLSTPYAIKDAPLYELCAVKATLTQKSKEEYVRKGLSYFKLTAKDNTGEITLIIFNSKYTVERLVTGKEYVFYGRMGGSLLRREILSPDIYEVGGLQIVPIYPQTAGITSKIIRSNMGQALADIVILPDPVPKVMRERLGFADIMESLRQIHFPPDFESAKQARNRFIFEELLVLCLALKSLRSPGRKTEIEPMQPVDLAPFYESLSFSPTSAQLRCIEEAVNDMLGGHPMNRLIQGDVGSGKTLVAVACAYFAACNLKQTAIMVPTEILAEQHRDTIHKMLEPFGFRVELLTSSTKAAERKRVLTGLALGEINVAVGTHALLSESVEFYDLGLVVTDEQHRFGVAQRARLSQKNDNIHVLTMSATPIPRTLSLIIYGDLSLSVLGEKPPGRQDVTTLLIDSEKRTRALRFIADALDDGKQAYIVCPLIEQGEVNTGLRPAAEYAASLAKNEFRGYRVGLLHGKMKPAEKEDVMRRFKAGEVQILVSTTVVEVGVDVPNATIIMIENAERFGLSQLHQLRGRVGRTSDKCWCILVSDIRQGVTGERLRVMKTVHDGFLIAEHDLKLRGPGDFFGSRQHGLPTLKVADLADDISVFKVALAEAELLLQLDPNLALPQHKGLATEMMRMLTAVGERPN